MTSDQRPISPHLQVYRWQLTSVMSILHRLTGIALAVGAILLVSWIGSASDGPVSFAKMQWFLGSPGGLILMFGWSVALFYHLCNGIRHMWWDTGRGLELKSVYATGYAVLVATAALTIVAWAVGLSRWGL
ncbi:MAG TPA: succinate dehydrogenase, cytochrome b556 subunit [Stellaceae bacterium]|jgi:succinate dehydrogenase / fumarate reductase cytochrome b subunit|nr:succinate dehydrogenase, cytochrome b556 subunit [Stellaceae bacterium]